MNKLLTIIKCWTFINSNTHKSSPFSTTNNSSTSAYMKPSSRKGNLTTRPSITSSSPLNNYNRLFRPIALKLPNSILKSLNLILKLFNLSSLYTKVSNYSFKATHSTKLISQTSKINTTNNLTNMNKESDNFNKKYSKKITKLLSGKLPYYNNKVPSISLKHKYPININKSNHYFKTKLVYMTKSTNSKARLTLLIMKNNKFYKIN